MREDVVGRANVEDTPELQAYYKDLERFEAAALWTVANKIEPWEPQSRSVPVLWRYQDLRDHVLRSVSLVTPEKAGRRVIYLNNPGRRDVAAAVGWLYSGLQVMHPGEVASAHAHSASALRFIMEGERRLHHRRRPQDDAAGKRLRAHSQRHLARARRRGERHALHLAGRARHSAGQRARGEFLRGSSRSCSRRSLTRWTTRRNTWGNPGLRPAHGRIGAKAIRRCFNTSGSRPTRRCSATAARRTARPTTAC